MYAFCTVPTTPADRLNVHQMTINMLSDDVLLEIFNFVVNDRKARISQWHTLIHVCRRWRCVVFASPRHLNLRLAFTGLRPVSEMLDTWPVLPVAITHRTSAFPSRPPPLLLDSIWHNIAATLDSEHYSRICEIDLDGIPNSQMERFAEVMQKPFPELTLLHLSVGVPAGNIAAAAFPNSLFGGSIPRLRELWLDNCHFPTLHKLLLSAGGLVILHLWNIPHSEHISPEAMVVALSVMTRLETLHLKFRSPHSRPGPGSRHPPPPARLVLQAITELVFQGVHEYLEDLVAQIDTPLLYTLCMVFLMDITFDVPHLHRSRGKVEEAHSTSGVYFQSQN